MEVRSREHDRAVCAKERQSCSTPERAARSPSRSPLGCSFSPVSPRTQLRGMDPDPAALQSSRRHFRRGDHIGFATLTLGLWKLKRRRPAVPDPRYGKGHTISTSLICRLTPPVRLEKSMHSAAHGVQWLNFTLQSVRASSWLHRRCVARAEATQVGQIARTFGTPFYPPHLDISLNQTRKGFRFGLNPPSKGCLKEV